MILSKDSTASYYTYWPSPVALTLYALTGSNDSGDTFASGVSQSTCRETPIEKSDLAFVQVMAGVATTSWQVWDRGQSAYPKMGDVLATAAGVRWRVRNVRILIFGNLYVCACVKEVA